MSLFFLLCALPVLVVVNHYMAFQYFAQEYYPFSEVKSAQIYDLRCFLRPVCDSFSFVWFLTSESRCWPTSPSASGWFLSPSSCLCQRGKMCFRPPCSKEVRSRFGRLPSCFFRQNKCHKYGNRWSKIIRLRGLLSVGSNLASSFCGSPPDARVASGINPKLGHRCTTCIYSFALDDKRHLSSLLAQI